jgi:hypothetical protein
MSDPKQIKSSDSGVALTQDARTPTNLTAYGRQLASRIFYGYFPYDDNQYFLNLVRDGRSNNQQSEAVIDGHRTYVLESRNRYGLHTLWLDPNADFAPRRIRLEKRGTDLFNGEQIGLMKISKVDFEQRPRLPMRGLVWQVDIRLDDGRKSASLVSGFTMNETRFYEGGATFDTKDEFTITYQTRDAKVADLRPTLEVPEGTVVQLTKAPAVVAEWRNGEVVKVRDRKVVRPRTKLAPNNVRRTGSAQPVPP